MIEVPHSGEVQLDRPIGGQLLQSFEDAGDMALAGKTVDTPHAATDAAGVQENLPSWRGP
ncbi:hypothetical protein ACF09G_26100 [Streptomyces albogriseolus]|uniref:hypothetical protein n=1 Tax=Streptomyces albogriseolus TaxID=1887 RepID=UPI0036FEEAC5